VTVASKKKRDWRFKEILDIEHELYETLL